MKGLKVRNLRHVQHLSAGIFGDAFQREQFQLARTARN